MNSINSQITTPSFNKLAKILETDTLYLECQCLLEAMKISLRSHPRLFLVDDRELYTKLELLSQDLLETIDILQMQLCRTEIIDIILELFLSRTDYLLKPTAACK